ncbi:BCCT family transporter [Thalassomonas actiniarum]|uniref:BCCT family transporter n=1 Tax=Thalassomonas actiniarum TaxID=485447 RepID=A0AAE9YQW1_9GAMM|nr:BCCT family transporter [Thalassomonas actiniarum]WDD98624.1 BCCT family transporter [Thalassomonas actiniarum]
MKLDVSKINPPVFLTSSLLIIGLLLFTIFTPDIASGFFSNIQAGIIANGSWFYVLTVAVILGFVIYLSMSRFGSIKLGPDHISPDYKLSTWLSMLFAAGMGIGLMFFGVAEPIMHYLSPPTAEQGSLASVKEAMKITFFHWGLHAWAIYAIVALILAYFCYRHKLPLTLRSALHPIIGDRIYGWPGHIVDTFAVVSTVFGVATSLGLGASQVNAGLNYLFSIEVSQSNQVLIMVAIAAFASISVATGLDKGIKILSEINMGLAIVLLLLIFVLGPTVFLLQAYVQNIGAYLSDIVSNTFNLFAYEKKSWIGGWTIFYWGWWLAWAPFVGLFIARISKGRTIREFVIGVMLVPTAFTLLWMTIFGNSAISLVVDQGVTELTTMIGQNSAVGLFVFLENFPWATALTGLSILMIVIFFVTSCDSGAMVIDMLCSNGRNDTPLWQRLFWAIGVGVVAAVLSLAGGLDALQTMTIASALPFSIVLLMACFGLIKALQIESAKRESLQINVVPSNYYDKAEDWREKLDNIVSTPDKKNADFFINKTVKKAFAKLKEQFETNNISAEVSVTETGLAFKVFHGDEHDFIYGVHKKKLAQPDFTLEDSDSYYRAEVHLLEGGQDYDIMGWSEIAVINDVIEQYQKHMHFLHLLRE